MYVVYASLEFSESQQSNLHGVALTFHVQYMLAVMLLLVLGFGLKAKFCGLGLGLGTFLALALDVWPWQKIQGQNLGRLQNLPLTSIHWSTVTGLNYISRSKFLTYLQWAIVA